VGQKLRGRLHITEVADPPAPKAKPPSSSPLAGFSEGQRIQVHGGLPAPHACL
jgi:hypothetical protein